VDYVEVGATFTFPKYDLPKLREIANNWAERGYFKAKDLLKLEKAGMADVGKIPPRWAPSKRYARSETRRRVFEEWPTEHGFLYVEVPPNATILNLSR
jgi:hypothetical protein